MFFWSLIQTYALVLGKWVFILFALLAVFGTLLVIFRAKHWKAQLASLEQQAWQARDDVMFNAMASRAELSHIKQRLVLRANQPDHKELTSQVVKYAGAAVMLLMKKETSMVQWAFAGAKLANSAFRMFKSIQKN